MSVFVSDFAPTDVPGSWTVTHDDAYGGAHTGSIDPTEVVHTRNMDNSENHNFAVVTCPVCGAASTHPVGGGAQPGSVQQMFVTMCQTNGCPCGQIAATDPDGLGESHVRLQVNRLDGAGRWQLA
jgi:hypothetical protein